MNMNNKSELNYRIYDSNSKECQLSNLKNGWKFRTLIKFDSIWIDTDRKKFGINLDLVQLKIYQPISRIRCLIDNDTYTRELSKYTNNNSIEDCAITRSNPSKPISDFDTGKKKVFVPPNPDELLKIRNALKKVLE